jgi:excisionase family DNA binding protein
MDKLLTADEVAELLKVNTEWVWAQARAGRIPHVRLGWYRRFRKSALEAWLLDPEAGSRTPRAATPPGPVPLRRRA